MSFLRAILNFGFILEFEKSTVPSSPYAWMLLRQDSNVSILHYVKQAYHHKNDGRAEISDVCADRLFDHCRFASPLSFSLIRSVQFKFSTDIDFFP